MTVDDMHDPDWWRSAVVYQIYPRSFKDADNNGIGDLKGVDLGLPYLAELGVDAIWLSPFYPSPMVDGGYDVSDYRDVDSNLGSLADFDALVLHAHQLGIKVIIDIVPNHCSDQHPWFRQALEQGPNSPMASRFVFRRGKGRNGELPPTNWISDFGGSAWEPCGEGWYYLHIFSKEQPDFNWDNEEVRRDFLQTLRFWSNRGADGFRVDVSHGLVKDLHAPLRDRANPEIMSPLSPDGDDPLFDRDGVHEVYRSWRRVLDEYDPPRMAIGESWFPINERVFEYARGDELGAVFDFSLVKCAWDRNEYMSAISRAKTGFNRVDGTPSWVLGNHDVPRVSSRLALPKGTDEQAWVTSDGSKPCVDAALGLSRARAAALVMLALPGTAYVYQGDELGLPEDLELGRDAIRDPQWERSGHRFKGRDGCRVPLPWTNRPSTSYGFNQGAEPWLPQPSWFSKYAIDSQVEDRDSTLSLYRKAIALRKQWVGADGLCEIGPIKDEARQILHLRLDSGMQCMTNFGDHAVELPEGIHLLLCSGEASEFCGSGMLEPNTSVWFTQDRPTQAQQARINDGTDEE